MNAESEGRGAVVRRRHNGDRYAGKASKLRNSKGKAVAKGTVTVLSESSELQRPIRGHVLKRPTEAGNDPSYISWEEKYSPPRDAVFHKADISEALRAVRRHSPDFRHHLAEQFARAVREHFTRHSVSQCPVEVHAIGHYPLNKKAGTFYQAQVGAEIFVVPAKFFQYVTLRARPKQPSESPTMRRRPKVLKK